MTTQNGAARPLTIALVQANPTVGDFDRNMDFARETCIANKDADLIAFPECFVTGYSLEDLVLRPGFLSQARQQVETFAKFIAELDGPAVLIGAPIAGTDLPFNAAHLITPDGAIRTIVKNELPNSDVFDERRTFDQGSSPKPLTIGEWRMGAGICEDMWHGRVTRALIDELVDFTLWINGSPFEIDKMNVRLAHARERVRQSGKPLIYLNMTGGQDELVFDGGSFVLDRQGNVVAQMRAFSEEVMRIQLTKTYNGIEVAVPKPYVAIHPYPDRLESIYQACVMGLRDYVDKNGFPHVVIGVSGGLDSALVAAMAADALGPSRVYGLMMPTQYTSKESLELADQLMRRIDCRRGSASIDTAFKAMEGLLQAVEATRPFDRPTNAEARSVASENFQPRIRGALLMGITNAMGGLVLSTGNKSEMSVGYATLYGDMCGGYNPIKDLYKTTAFELCRWRNANRREWMLGNENPIPERIITRPPTAELKDNQTDEKALGSYELLDAVLKLLIENMLDVEEVRQRVTKQMGRTVDLAYVRKIAGLVKNAEYKRRQSPPGVKLTSRSFGKGWRYPITNRAGF